MKAGSRLALLAITLVCWVPRTARAQPDWLVDPGSFVARAETSPDGRELTLSNGLARRTFRLTPNAATVALDNLMTGESMLRGVKPEARVTINGIEHCAGGLVGQPDYAYLDPAWLDDLRADPAALVLQRFELGRPQERLAWGQVRRHAPGIAWPPPGVELRMDYQWSPGEGPAFALRVHYELYDGIPLFCKWIEVTNTGSEAIRIDGFNSEILAAVEASSFVGGDPGTFEHLNIYVETDYAMGGSMQSGEAVLHGVRWRSDPDYLTQVHYERQTPCLLEAGPDLGPAALLAPGETFESFRTWELIQDSTDRERRGLAVRRMYRTIAPWVTENPLMMHVRWSDWDTVRNAVDQCADVGFEMIILTFGSGFDIENETPEYLAGMKKLADYARSKGIEIGGYSLLASRSINPANDVVMPAGQRPIFGNSPCLGSTWGLDYFRKLHQFYDSTGFMLLEHDGSYPGDACASTDHPGHAGLEDSRWAQWRQIATFYGWCRAKGVYLNVPDWYYLSGSSKCGMGYRETNWSLPRAQQVIHTRQNIYDGTWSKTPSMGWMFVPLTEYQGGGEAATIEPLAAHLDHYERMLYSNLALGVQACYRGPRLYDTPETRDLVKQWVDWYLANRDILESDVIHGRRADGRDLDWMLHVNPALETKGMLVVFNPTPAEVTRALQVDLHYAGLTGAAVAEAQSGRLDALHLGVDGKTTISVTVPAEGMTWIRFREP
ncbi:MAG: alpha-galactosidase [Phycisphaerales bacterium]|nr:alpha-galactosidase [Phycisphaerales bacterium]